MDNSNIISFTPSNWITVTLMAAISFAALGALQKFIKQRSGS